MRMTLTEFLLARYAEDEAAAERGASHNGGSTFAKDNYGCLLVQPAHILADIDAKREVMIFAKAVQADMERLVPSGWQVTVQRTIERQLALPYADHPDYDEGWRP